MVEGQLLKLPSASFASMRRLWAQQVLTGTGCHLRPLKELPCLSHGIDSIDLCLFHHVHGSVLSAGFEIFASEIVFSSSAISPIVDNPKVR